MMLTGKVESDRHRLVEKSAAFAGWVHLWLKQYEDAANRVKAATTIDELRLAAKDMEKAVPGGDTWEYLSKDWGWDEIERIAH